MIPCVFDFIPLFAHHRARYGFQQGVVMTFYIGQKWHRKKRAKHGWAKGSIKTDALQRKQLASIRRLLAEKGYQIYPVATWFRRSVHDFLAVPREHPNMLLLVRPSSRRRNEILYYGYKGSYHHIKQYLDAHASTCGSMVWGRQLPAKDKANDWKAFVSRNCQRELRLFTNA